MKQEDESDIFEPVVIDNPVEFVSILNIVSTDCLGNRSYVWAPILEDGELTIDLSIQALA